MDCYMQPPSLLPPLQSCLQGLAEGLAAWLCYLAVVQVDNLPPAWDVTASHRAHSTGFFLQCHLGWWDY